MAVQPLERVLVDHEQSAKGFSVLEEAYDAAVAMQCTASGADTGSSDDTVAGALAQVTAGPLVPMQMSCSVLCYPVWSRPSVELVAPPELQGPSQFACRLYEASRQDNRKLLVSFTDGTVELDVVFPGGRRTLVMPPVLAAILLHMQGGGASAGANSGRSGSMTCAAAAAASGLSEDLVLEHVRPLVFSMSKVASRSFNVLRVSLWGDESTSTGGCSPLAGGQEGTDSKARRRGPQDLKAHSVLKINSKFKNPLRRIKVPKVSIQSDASKREAEDEQTDQDRSKVLQAAIVRLMKARKKLRFQDIVVETTKLVRERFEPAMRQIRREVEGLVERDYLERDEDDPHLLRYLA